MGGLQHLHFILIYERIEEKYIAEEPWTSLAHLFNSSLRYGVMQPYGNLPTLLPNTKVTKRNW